MPCRLCIDLDCLMILRASLAAAAPQEGCALLLGEAAPDICVRLVWPCCNVWHPGFPGFGNVIEASGVQAASPPSRRTRFALDPREQIAAQRWSRQRNLQVIGSAHSHPGGRPVPSALDRGWAASEGVMIIDSVTGGVAAWWLQGVMGSKPSALPIAVQGDSVVGDPVSSCFNGPSLPLK